MEPELLVEDPSDVSFTEVCSERHEAVQGKGCHCRVEDLGGDIGVTPALSRDGERHAWREHRSEQGGRVVHLDVDIGHRPHKDVHVRPVAAKDHEHALQRQGPCACRVTYGRSFCTSPPFAKCCEAQRSESR